jgi:hypothetical protein
VTHNAVRFEFVDGASGDGLERPPNGHPTAAALAACTSLIPAAWIGELMRRERPFVQSLCSPSSLGCCSSSDCGLLLDDSARNIALPPLNPSCWSVTAT